MSNPGDRSAAIVARFREITASTVGQRPDLRITDCVEVNPGRTFRLVLSYDQDRPVPDMRDVAQCIKHYTNDSVAPNLATARVHNAGRHHGVSVMVEARVLTRPFADAADKTRMIPVIANTLFMDVALGDNWHVAVDESTGVKRLECTKREDVGAILANAVTASVRTHAGLSFGDETVAGACCPEKGDVVMFYADNAQRQGTVMSVKGQDVRVAEADGNSFIVPIVSIIDIVQKNEASQQQAINEEASFFAEFYGKDFVREFFPAAKI